MINNILLQAGASGGMGQIMLLVGMIAVFYLFMIRPQQKKQKTQRVFREALKKGDYVITIGGIYGKITATEGEALFIEVDKGIKLKVEKSAISSEASMKLQTPAESK